MQSIKTSQEGKECTTKQEKLRAYCPNIYTVTEEACKHYTVQRQGLWQNSFVLSYTTAHCLADAYQNNEMFDKILSLLACQMITILMMSEFRSVKE